MADCPWLESIGTCGHGRRCAIDLTPMLSSSVISASLIHYFSQQILDQGDDDKDDGHKKKRRKQSPATSINTSIDTSSINTNIDTAIPPFAAIVFSDALGHSENLSRLLAASLHLATSPLRIGKIDVMEEEMENENNDDDAHAQLLPTVQSWLASNPIDRRVLLVQDWISCPGERPHEL